jgi:integrase
VLSREQEPVYLKAAPEPLKDLALLMLDTGLRDGEALALKWPDVHLRPAPTAKFGYLQVHKGKSPKARRTVSLTARVRTMLAARSKKSSSEFAFPGRKGKPILVTSLDHQHAKVRNS